jgi:hypothetical protein
MNDGNYLKQEKNKRGPKKGTQNLSNEINIIYRQGFN